MTKPAALLSWQIGMRNLAQTAGYADPLRLEWAVGAETVKDLAAAGWLCPARVFVAQNKLNLCGVHTVAGDYNKGELERAVAAADIAGDTTFLIGAWNFADELMQKIRKLSDGAKPKFVIYFPQLQEIG